MNGTNKCVPMYFFGFRISILKKKKVKEIQFDI